MTIVCMLSTDGENQEVRTFCFCICEFHVFSHINPKSDTISLGFGKSSTSRLSNIAVKTFNPRNASTTTPKLHRKRQVETSPVPPRKRLHEQSTCPPAGTVIDDLEPPADAGDDLSRSSEQPSAICTIDDVEYPVDGANDDIPLPFEDPLASATSIKIRFCETSARVLADPTIPNCLLGLSADPPATSGDQNRLCGQYTDLAAVETAPFCKPGRPMLETIKAFADLTPQTLELILKDHRGRVAFPNLKADPADFRRLQKLFPGETDPSFEYDANDKKITLLTPATPIHQKVEMAVQGWLEEVADEITNGEEAYGCVTQYEVELAMGSTKVPDVVLLPQKAGSYPLVAVEIGLTEPLDKLYEDAECLIQGSNGAIESVILVDLTEGNRHRGHSHPWGQDPEILRSKTCNDLSSIIEAWFNSQGLTLIGTLTAKCFSIQSNQTLPPESLFTPSHITPIHTR